MVGGGRRFDPRPFPVIVIMVVVEVVGVVVHKRVVDMNFFATAA